MQIDDLISEIQLNQLCKLNKSCDSEELLKSNLPPDLVRFYQLHNGCEFFPEAEYSWRLLPFELFKCHDEIFTEFDCNGTIISDKWIVFLEEINHNTPYAIDLSPERFGYCYQVSQYDYPYILTHSFFEIIEKIYALKGAYPPWYKHGYKYYGDPCKT
jgi:cell wall assembly regulator SMI1